MARRSQQEILEELQRKRDELNADIKSRRAKLRQKERKEDTRRKILWGAFIMKLIEQNRHNEGWARMEQDFFATLEKDVDRELFGLPTSSSATSGE